MAFVLRTIDRQGDFQQVGREACIIRACSMAELLSDRTLYGNVIVTNLRDRSSLSFIEGRAIKGSA